MQKAIDNNEFLEFAHVHTNIYGTSFAAIEKVKSAGT
jgi:guanylate kinase